MPAIYNGERYFGGYPTKTSQLNNDAHFTKVNDSTASNNETYSSNKINALIPTITVQTTEPSEVAENEIVFVVEEEE